MPLLLEVPLLLPEPLLESLLLLRARRAWGFSCNQQAHRNSAVVLGTTARPKVPLLVLPCIYSRQVRIHSAFTMLPQLLAHDRW